MSGFRLVFDYPHTRERVWRVLTDPDLIPLWTSTGRGARPVGFSAVVGSRFQFLAKPMPGWNGVVDCEVLEAVQPSRLRFTWLSGGSDTLTTVTCCCEPIEHGTRLSWEHTGFRGIGGFIVSKILATVRRKMLSKGFPSVLSGLEEGEKSKRGERSS